MNNPNYTPINLGVNHLRLPAPRSAVEPAHTLTSLQWRGGEDLSSTRLSIKQSGPISEQIIVFLYMGLSENSVPLHPMVNDHYPY